MPNGNGKIKIVSDGTGMGTRVEGIPDACAVDFHISATDNLCTARVTLRPVSFDYNGPVSFVATCSQCGAKVNVPVPPEENIA